MLIKAATITNINVQNVLQVFQVLRTYVVYLFWLPLFYIKCRIVFCLLELFFCERTSRIWGYLLLSSPEWKWGGEGALKSGVIGKQLKVNKLGIAINEGIEM